VELAEVDLVGMRKSKSVKALELCHLDDLGSVSDYRADHAVDFEIHHVDLGVRGRAFASLPVSERFRNPTFTTQAQSGATEALDADASDPLACAS